MAFVYYRSIKIDKYIFYAEPAIDNHTPFTGMSQFDQRRYYTQIIQI